MTNATPPIIRKIPNMLSILRMVISVGLFFLLDHVGLFLFLYLIAGCTEALDGFIARRYRVASALGARLDSIGDFFFYMVLVVFLFVNYVTVCRPYFMAAGVILAIRMINIGIGFLRFGKLVMVHTIANKTAGLAVFLVPVFLWVHIDVYLAVVVALAGIAAMEEMVIIVTSRKMPDPDRKSIFRP